MKVIYYINDEQEKIEFTPAYEELIKKAVEAALEYEEFENDCEISITITDNESIREINKEYRDIDRETDVLSFPMDEDDMLGDVVLSLEKAKSQAEEYGHGIEREIAFLTVHSVLHLLGYDHERSKKEDEDMCRRQREIVEKLGL